MDAVSPASPLCLLHFRSPSSPFSSSLSLSLPHSFVPPVLLSLSPPFTLFLVLGLCPAPFLFWSFPLVSLSCSALDSRNPFISRSRFRGSVPFFPPFRPICSLFPPLPLPLPPRCQPRPCFAALYARAFPASPALRSDRLRIHCEIDRPKRVPEWPERTRMQQKGMGWHMRSGRFKGTPQERDATATRCIATPLSSSVFSGFPFRQHVAVFVCPMHLRIPLERIRK